MQQASVALSQHPAAGPTDATARGGRGRRRREEAQTALGKERSAVMASGVRHLLLAASVHRFSRRGLRPLLGGPLPPAVGSHHAALDDPLCVDLLRRAGDVHRELDRFRGRLPLLFRHHVARAPDPANSPLLRHHLRRKHNHWNPVELRRAGQLLPRGRFGRDVRGSGGRPAVPHAVLRVLPPRQGLDLGLAVAARTKSEETAAIGCGIESAGQRRREGGFAGSSVFDLHFIIGIRT